MINFKKQYIAYQIDIKNRDKQTQEAMDLYERRFKTAPQIILQGPVVSEQGYIIIKENEIWIELPTKFRKDRTTAYTS